MCGRSQGAPSPHSPRQSRHTWRGWVTGEAIRRYEHDHPVSIIHVDVTKSCCIPDGGGHRFVGRQQGKTNRAAPGRRTGNRDEHHGPRLGINYLHTVIDDHSRIAYAWFAVRGVTRRTSPVRERQLLPIPRLARRLRRPEDHHKRTRPYRPQTNGKIERFHRTLADGWAYARFYDYETTGREALANWLHSYNHHRAHSAIEP